MDTALIFQVPLEVFEYILTWVGMYCIVARFVCRTLRDCIQIPSRSRYVAFTNHLARSGNLNLLKWFHDTGTYSISEDHAKSAAAGGHTQIIQYVSSNNIWISPDVCSAAVRAFRWDVVEWLKCKGFCWKLQDVAMMYRYAGKTGKIEVFDRLSVLMGPNKCKVWFCVGAAKNGHLQALQDAHARGIEFMSRVCSAAVKGGHPEILWWLRTMMTPPCPWDERVCTYAAKRGDLDTLKWARSCTPPCSWSSSICDVAAKNGQLHVLKWVFTFPIVRIPAHIILCAIKGQRYEVIEYLVTSGIGEVTRQHLRKAVKMRLVKLVRFLVELGGVCEPELCNISAKRGDLRMLKWLRAPCRKDGTALQTRSGHVVSACPWTSQVLHIANREQHLGLWAWAKLNGSPECSCIICPPG
jgi:hypothetical protein